MPVSLPSIHNQDATEQECDVTVSSPILITKRIQQQDRPIPVSSMSLLTERDSEQGRPVAVSLPSPLTMQGKETAARTGFVKRMIEDINKRENKITPKKNIKKTIRKTPSATKKIKKILKNQTPQKNKMMKYVQVMVESSPILKSKTTFQQNVIQHYVNDGNPPAQGGSNQTEF